MFDFARAARIPSIMLALLVSCAGDESRHVFQSSPPVRESARPVAPPQAPDPPVGTSGPSARVVAVLSSSTGSPASLDQVDGDVDIVTLVSRGRGSSAQGPVRIELRITGSIDTTLVHHIGTPVPVIIAHTFRVAVGGGAAGLSDGRFELQVRLVGPTGRQIAGSVPVHVGVRVQRADEAVGP